MLLLKDNFMIWQDDGRLELALEKGAKIKLTTNDEFKEKCTKDILWVDYKNITKVLQVLMAFGFLQLI
jgi:hypothetical protein